VFGYYLRSSFGIVATDSRAISNRALWSCGFGELAAELVKTLALSLARLGAGSESTAYVACVCAVSSFDAQGRSPRRDVDEEKVVALACATLSITSRLADASMSATVSKS
ncbi:hypothetical protein EVAR_102921_1, partial [Eumeta japonica]